MRRSKLVIIAAVLVVVVGIYVWGEVDSNSKECFAATADAGPPTTITYRC